MKKILPFPPLMLFLYMGLVLFFLLSPPTLALAHCTTLQPEDQ